MKAKLVNEMVYEHLSVEEFVSWFEELQEIWSDLPWYNLISSLENDEDSTDGELYDYFLSELGIKDTGLIEELLEKRQYFMNFEYAQHINAE